MSVNSSRHGESHPVRILEIRAGEGGGDARLFVADLAGAYLKLADDKA